MTEQRKSFEEEQKDLAVARERMLEVYFDRIRKRYNEGPARVRSSISNRLEKIAYNGPRKKGKFDWKRATQIRISAGLIQLELSELLRMNQGQLSHYESGYRTPRNITYITWLRENGYDLMVSEED